MEQIAQIFVKIVYNVIMLSSRVFSLRLARCIAVNLTFSNTLQIYLEMAQAMDLYYGSPETDVPHLADIFNLLLTPGTLL